MFPWIMYLPTGSVNVFPVAPSPGNAPSHAMPTLYYLRENLELMLRAQLLLKEDIERNGGMLRVGVYAHAVPINDLGQRIVTMLDVALRGALTRLAVFDFAAGLVFGLALAAFLLRCGLSAGASTV